MKVSESETVWHGNSFDFNCEKVILPNGKKTEMGLVRHPGSSAIIPVLENGSILLIYQYRSAVRRFIWEIPSGTMLPGEEPLACAARELQEETGFDAKKFERLGEILIAPWYSDEKISLFLATELIPCEKHLDEDEVLTPHPFTFDQTMSMIDKGDIQDATTILGLKMAAPLWKKTTF